MRIYLNDGWAFQQNYDEHLKEQGYDDSQLPRVRLPHTVAETPLHYFDESIYQMVSGYRKVIKVPEEWRSRHVLLTVEAAAHMAWVYVNGKEAAVHKCGYTAFTVDIAPLLAPGTENVLAIKVDSRESLNIPPFGKVIDYMTYGGLYREVWLDIRESMYIEDVFVKAKDVRVNGKTGSARLECEVRLSGIPEYTDRRKNSGTENMEENGTVPASGENRSNQAEPEIRHFLLSLSGEVICAFPKGEHSCQVQEIQLWDTENPVLYLLRTELVIGGKTLDCREERIGIREAVFLADGFYLNGRKRKLRGLNRHQSYPYVGYAMPESMQKLDADILKKELGVNAVRTSHYPQSHYFLDRCDELGLLAFTEIPGWQHIGDEEWQAQAVKNTEEMVTQYRNHPSVILWGVRINESLDNDGFYEKTNAAARKMDETRQTSGVRYLQKSSLLEDVYAYNDFSHDGSNAGCVSKKKSTPDRKKAYLISEYNGHMFPAKSFDCEEHLTEQMIRHANVMNAYYKEQDIAGGFGWCMFDYNTHRDFGSGDRICYHGVMDMFRNSKAAGYLYKAQESEEAVLEISSSMDIGEHPACLMKEVYAVTNADCVRVYKNDICVGEYEKSSSPFPELPHGPVLIGDFIGDMIEKGEGFSHGKAEDIKKILLAANRFGLAHLPFSTLLLAAKCILFRGMKMQDAVELYNKYVGNWGGTATAYRFEAVKDGKVVKTAVKKPMTQISLQTEVSHRVLVEKSTYDTALVRIKAADENGNTLRFFNEAVHLETQGDICLVGPSDIALQGGMGGTYVKSLGKAGEGRLCIRTNGAEPAEILFQVSKQENRKEQAAV